MLSTNAVSQEGECATVVREKKLHIGMAKEQSRTDDRRDGTASVEWEFLNDCRGVVSLETSGIEQNQSHIQGPNGMPGGMTVSAG